MFHVWDTAGLDEGTHGRVPAEVAEKHLAKLLRELGSANGIHLLVYCIRGASVRKALARNYTIFYSAICRKKVPIVAVVTGLENEPSSMEGWWIQGEKDLAKYKMRFDDHACVTTVDMQRVAGTPLEERSKQSQEAVRRLIIDNCRRIVSRPSDTNILIKAALLDLRSMMKSSDIHVGSHGRMDAMHFSRQWKAICLPPRRRPFAGLHTSKGLKRRCRSVDFCRINDRAKQGKIPEVLLILRGGSLPSPRCNTRAVY
ncbi:hypothetical protein BS17DRAFT_783161 [Gyrodon lividus]|nr:hypothetical protein BS17DRAFT_783161 [Gyrodon lividus]